MMEKMKNLLIYGAGGHGREVLELAQTLNKHAPRWKILGFIDDGKNAQNGFPILGNRNFFDSLSEPVDVVFGFAACGAKEKIYHELKRNPLISFPTLIHPSAVVADSAEISEGCVIFNFCFVSVDTFMGKCSLLSAGTQLAHDSRLGDFCSVMPSVNISGNVEISDRVYIGVQSAIRQGVKVGSDSLVGMGSVVVKDVPSKTTVCGNPARKIST